MKRYALLVKSLIKGARPSQTPLGVRLFFEYTPPRSWPKKKRQEAIGQPKTSTPDLSNLIKFTEDALNGILWEDDRLITAIVASKRYSESEGTVIEVFEIGETDENDL